MEVIIDFPGGARVDARFGAFVVHTDQPPYGGGEGSAPTPFATFLASIGACAGLYVLSFCQRRGISSDGLRLIQRLDIDSTTGLVRTIHMEIVLPNGFPERYRQAVIHAAEQCAIKKHFERPPAFEIHTVTSQPVHP
jgi:ribosomal protein S12 methylthiotransferase accessory factor